MEVGGVFKREDTFASRESLYLKIKSIISGQKSGKRKINNVDTKMSNMLIMSVIPIFY